MTTIKGESEGEPAGAAPTAGSDEPAAGQRSGSPGDAGMSTNGREPGQVLIVDDSEADAAIMARHLEGLDHVEVVTAKGKREAETLTSQQSFDVVLLDYRMPGTSGLDYLEILRRRDADIGIVLVTAFSDEEVAVQSIRRRADDFLRKENLSREMIREAVERLLVTVRRRRSARLDPVMGVFDAESTARLIEEECAAVKRGGPGFCLLLADLDAFSRVNETYGHATGDRVLRRIAITITAVLESDQLPGRHRGEQICVIAPKTDAEGGTELAERLRERILGIEFDYGHGAFRVDCRVGGAQVTEPAPGSAAEVLAVAEAALQQARSSVDTRIRVLPCPREAPEDR